MRNFFKIIYRPEIDGLRALAVISVIIYHAQLSIFGKKILPGGYLGVDIFFVISGYLISFIILKELELRIFSLSNFYSRRIKRILPLLMFILICSYFLFAYILLPDTLVNFSKSIISSIFFISNFFFYKNEIDYGGTDGLQTPLLHTWSLSVEEQFYLIFPILLIFLWKFKKKIFTSIFILLLSSFIISNFITIENKNFSFYFTISRLWEFLAGTCLAVYQNSKQKYFSFTKQGALKIFNKLESILPFIAILMILLSLFYFDTSTKHPSYLTVIPVLGTCIIIMSSKKNFVVKILSLRPIVFVGVISYSLYLWHFPIFAFSRIENLTQGLLINKILLGVGIFCLSIFSYFFIEKPFRNKKYQKNVYRYLIYSIVLLLMINIFTILKNGEIHPYNTKIQKIYDNLESDSINQNCKISSSLPEFEKDSNFTENFEKCLKVNNEFILVIGDSHAKNIYNSLALNSNKFIVGLHQGGCRPNQKEQNCQYQKIKNFKDKYNKQISLTIFHLKGSYFLKNICGKGFDSVSYCRKYPINTLFVDEIFNYLKIISSEGDTKTIFLGPRMEPNITLDRSFFMEILKDSKKINDYDNTNKDLEKLDKFLQKESIKYNIKYISLIDILKFDISKDYLIDGNITFMDTDHWSLFGEVYFGKKIKNNEFFKRILQ